MISKMKREQKRNKFPDKPMNVLPFHLVHFCCVC